MLTATAPLALGVPPAGAKVAELNAIVRREAAAPARSSSICSAFGARNHVMADRVHPTAFGQIAIAQRALAVLAADGLAARASPGLQLIRYETTLARPAARRSDLRLPLGEGARAGARRCGG